MYGCEAYSIACADGTEQETEITRIGSQDAYNWGYDPVHWGVPEGSYSSDPDGPARILEYRQMVQVRLCHSPITSLQPFAAPAARCSRSLTSICANARCNFSGSCDDWSTLLADFVSTCSRMTCMQPARAFGSAQSHGFAVHCRRCTRWAYGWYKTLSTITCLLRDWIVTVCWTRLRQGTTTVAMKTAQCATARAATTSPRSIAWQSV